MKKALGQTVRDLKRGVNKKVLKVPSIEQKVLDATSNEPWGPHGSLLADIAQATRNYHEYQMIMGILWKRINDTGKNWRHVYKALTVLEYLVAHGSERVIDEIKEHAYQISTLSDFQYIDSSGRDQGSNVRRKSSSLVVLVSDKERIQEARQKAVANRDKFRGPSSTGGMYRPSSYSSSGGYGDRYDDDRYDDRNSYEREREWGYKEDDRYGRNGDPYGRDVDRYSRDSDEHNARDSYKDDDLRGRSQSVDGDRNGFRSRSSERDPGHVDDGQHSSRQLERNFSEQNLGAPPSYEDAVSDGRSPVHSERRDGENSGEPAPKPSSLPSNAGASQSTVTSTVPAFPVNQEVEAFDAFDPRSPVTAAPTTSTSAEVDLFGSLSDSFSSNSLAIVPAPSGPTASEADAPPNSGSGPTFATAASASYVNSQPFEDPFGDSPFKAVPSTDSAPAAPPQNFTSAASFQANMDQSTESSQPVAPKVDAVSNFDFGETLPGITYTPPTIPNAQQETTDILADILPPAAPSNTVASQAPFPAPTGHPAPPNANMFGGFDSLAVSTSPHASPQTQYYNENTFQQAAATQATSQSPTGASWMPQAGQPPQTPTGASWMPQTGQSPMSSQAALSDSTGALAIVPTPSSKDKFDPKSTVWADTLSRGLVNLNISGPKTNPLADIGVDFDAINRKEKRMEKPSAAPATSNVTMGKAMGSGTGMGRAGASSIRPPSNAMRGPVTGMGGGPFMGMEGGRMGGGPGMGMGMGGGPGMGMGMGGGPGMGMGMGMGGGPGLGMGGGPGMGMGMGGPGMGMGPGTGVGMGMGGYGGMNQQQQMGMGMNMSMGQRAQMQPPIGLPPGSAMPGNYNPAMGGGYGTQQPYGGGYR